MISVTVFVSLSQGECLNTAVTSYDPSTDTWSSFPVPLLDEKRSSHLVVVVPGEVCDAFSDFKHTYEGTAAVVIGGFSGDNLDPDDVLSSVEIFGCPEEESVPPLAELPM